MTEKFKALVCDKDEDGGIAATVRERTIDELPEGDVVVRVRYSCINYKDALAVTGAGKILRKMPMSAGIDLVGEVVSCSDEGGSFQAGQRVLLTGHGLGEVHSGGFSEFVRVKSSWLLPLPDGLSEIDAATAGTAGLTAALCVNALISSARLDAGAEVIVSGASGGVGSFAVRLLSQSGYKVAAISRDSAADYLKQLGASEVIDRHTLPAEPKPLDTARWSGAVDTVGGGVLATILSQAAYGAIVAACGLSGGMNLPTTVFPFILRGVRLEGVESVYSSNALRAAAWDLLVKLDPSVYDTVRAGVIGLEEVPAVCAQLLQGQHQGRYVVDLSA